MKGNRLFLCPDTIQLKNRVSENIDSTSTSNKCILSFIYTKVYRAIYEGRLSRMCEPGLRQLSNNSKLLLKQIALCGHEWYLENKQLFGTLQEVAASKKLLRVNRALLVLNTIHKISEVIGYRTTLKYPNRSFGWHLQLRTKLRCSSSLFSLCRLKYPGQLLLKEIMLYGLTA